MQNEITNRDNFPEVTEESIKSTVRRREEYSLSRDLRAKEDNEAIARRLLKEKEIKEAESTSSGKPTEE
jgi:hypothetical protein